MQKWKRSRQKEINNCKIKEQEEKNVPVLLPLGVIEEHGPHLPLGTDIYTSCTICRNVHKKATEMEKECIIAPPFYWGRRVLFVGFGRIPQRFIWRRSKKGGTIWLCW